MTGLTVGCAAACAALLLAELRGLVALRFAAKLLASIAFVAVGLAALASVGDDPARLGFARAVAVGLVLGALGDGCLGLPGRRWFTAGLAAFLAGHVAYVVGIACVEPPGRWLADAGWLAGIPLGLGLGVTTVLWRRLGRLRVPVLVYVATICAMVIAAIAASHGAALPERNRSRLVIGAWAFFASDLAVARERFLAPSLANKLWGLPAYYAGQLLLAWSIAGL